VRKSRQAGTDFVDALPSDGERRLMLAVLIDAIRTVSQRQPAGTHTRALRAWLRDRAWLESDDHSRTFSFMNICAALGFNADYIRRFVLHLPSSDRPVRLHRYAAKVEESWLKQRRQIAKASECGRPPLVRDSRAAS
jgi:hypothetical protein